MSFKIKLFVGCLLFVGVVVVVVVVFVFVFVFVFVILYSEAMDLNGLILSLEYCRQLQRPFHPWYYECISFFHPNYNNLMQNNR